MFAVIFEVQPRSGQWDAYLARGRMLKPEIERIDGFVDNVRYRSLTREGLILSLSSWRDEKAVVRWRIQARHHEAQEQGRAAILADYHLRVGEITHDTHLPPGHTLRQQRLDETEPGRECAYPARARRARLRHVRPPRGAAVLSRSRPPLLRMDGLPAYVCLHQGPAACCRA